MSNQPNDIEQDDHHVSKNLINDDNNGTSIIIPQNILKTPQTSSDLPIAISDFNPTFHLRQKQELTIEYRNLSLIVGKRKILNELNGGAKPRELLAIMGPSGAGKSTLLNVLAGRVVSGGNKKLTGSVLVNGKEIRPLSFRKRIAYVLQEDALFPTATAREALEFSARLRLPVTFSSIERKELVDELLKTLGLTHVQNTLVGSDLVRGLSGGEKKRVAVGVELITNPSILFLDEPTSGLDSYSAIILMKILRGLAATGCAIMCTIHQPSSEIFAQFDKLILLCKGNNIYAGPTGQSLSDAFSKVNLPIPLNTNPSDHIIFMTQLQSLSDLPSVQVLTDNLYSSKDSQNNNNNNNNNSINNFNDEIVFEAQSGTLTQIAMLSKREAIGAIRDKAGLAGRFGGTLFLNTLISLIFLGAANPANEDYTLQTHFGALTQIIIGALFGSSQPVLLTFPLERVTFVREYSTGTYNSVAYFISKLVVELPLSFITNILIFAVAYPAMQFQGNFMLLVLVTLLLSLASASTALLVGALVSNPKAVQEIAPIIFVPQLLFTGFFVQITQIPEFLRWIQYLCSAKYGINLAIIVEFGNCTELIPGEELENIVNRKYCEGLYEFNEVDPDLWWTYFLILMGIFLGFRLLSLIILTIKAKNFSS